jgi:hypothetical protein
MASQTIAGEAAQAVARAQNLLTIAVALHSPLPADFPVRAAVQKAKEAADEAVRLIREMGDDTARQLIDRELRFAFKPVWDVPPLPTLPKRRRRRS